MGSPSSADFKQLPAAGLTHIRVLVSKRSTTGGAPRAGTTADKPERAVGIGAAKDLTKRASILNLRTKTIATLSAAIFHRIVMFREESDLGHRERNIRAARSFRIQDPSLRRRLGRCARLNRRLLPHRKPTTSRPHGHRAHDYRCQYDAARPQAMTLPVGGARCPVWQTITRSAAARKRRPLQRAVSRCHRCQSHASGEATW
jgi:hypothetical protein